MPTKLNFLQKTVPQRIDQLRHTIKPDEGLTMLEVAENPAVRAAEGRVREICVKRKWVLKNYDETVGKVISVLVHPKTLAKHANQT
jgi:beta-mannanase